MFFEKRKYQIKDYTTIEELAPQLAGPSSPTWCLCNGFRVGSLTLLNDSTHEDGAQEYAVIKDGNLVESLTVSWFDVNDLIEELHGLETGPCENYGKATIRKHTSDYCHYCA